MKKELLDYIRTIYRNIVEVTDYIEDGKNISVTYTLSWKGLDGSIKLYDNYHINISAKEFTSYQRNIKLGGLLEEDEI